jgi:hypothetical protein
MFVGKSMNAGDKIKSIVLSFTVTPRDPRSARFDIRLEWLIACRSDSAMAAAAAPNASEELSGAVVSALRSVVSKPDVYLIKAAQGST